jgi:hypothetical protein
LVKYGPQVSLLKILKNEFFFVIEERFTMQIDLRRCKEDLYLKSLGAVRPKCQTSFDISLFVALCQAKREFHLISC